MIQFDTTSYQFSHGKYPRGYGSWIFAPAGHENDQAEWIEVPHSTFQVAKHKVTKLVGEIAEAAPEVGVDPAEVRDRYSKIVVMP